MTGDDQAVFRALADPTRRALLDALFAADGQTLGDLVAAVGTPAGMTRFGVSKHLGVLEDAGLVTTLRDGRTKRHFLNPVPVALIARRWISKYAEPFAAALAGLSTSLDGSDTGDPGTAAGNPSPTSRSAEEAS